ncbi:ARM repeat-containing protein [Piedraia hortae CBS 480.64]|uniref:ARM repeat-containing protein n=1 Tax=Piedraia hortae CBS 480.64 TaxID=1314780 RepID=A0A6A7BU51_9PEZI|nr:ARM repeat-containing protein [Piedraia hortae CBS 480.64]
MAGLNPAQPQQLDAIKQALAATFDPKTTNEVRQQALQLLDRLKHDPEAPPLGFGLVTDASLGQAVRFYGAQLLEFAIKNSWDKYDESQRNQLREWVKTLATTLGQNDALLWNKAAQLWVELSKRCWGDLGWREMDSLLASFWDWPLSPEGIKHKIFVLQVLGALTEDIIINEDAIAGLRVETLGPCLNEILVPPQVYSKLRKKRGDRNEVRSNGSGWLLRIKDVLVDCLTSATPDQSEPMIDCALKALETLQVIFSWIGMDSVADAGCIEWLFLPITSNNLQLKIAAVEALYMLLRRPHHPHAHDAWLTVRKECEQLRRVMALKDAFVQANCAPEECDEKHTLQVKISELLSVMAETIIKDGHWTPDLPAFFELTLLVAQSKSLLVSIPVLHSWCTVMSAGHPSFAPVMSWALGPLITMCGERLIRYEAISRGSEDEIMAFLEEDFDTDSERHSFLAHYRRYCTRVIQSITSSWLQEALDHVLSQMCKILGEGPFTFDRGFDPVTYTRNSLPLLMFDATFSIVSSALDGFASWLVKPREQTGEEIIQKHLAVNQMLWQWAHVLMKIPVDDPKVASQVVQTLVSIMRMSQPDGPLVRDLTVHIFSLRFRKDDHNQHYSEAVAGFECVRVAEMQKLAYVLAPLLASEITSLEPIVSALAEEHRYDARLCWGCRAFLFAIIHRTPSDGDDELRLRYMTDMVNPVVESWKSPGLAESVQSLPNLCKQLCLDDLGDFYRKSGFDQTEDWSQGLLDVEGQAKQSAIKAAVDGLPLRMTKSMLGASIDHLAVSAEAYQRARMFWAPVTPIILERSLQLLTQVQAFYNMTNWSHLPPELQATVHRTLQDRFWQSGISHESKEAFFDRVEGSKSSYEGFASTVRGALRNVRELCYNSLFQFSKLQKPFYDLHELGPMMASAIFKDAHHLATSQMQPIVSLITMIVQRCPPDKRRSFLTPILNHFFLTMDAKLQTEWDAVAKTEEQTNRALEDEMRAESTLRQLTVSVMSFVNTLLDLRGDDPSNFILEEMAVFEPLMVLCTHALRFRDTRCCTVACRSFRRLMPRFEDADAVREYMCSEVLKSAITSVHDPYFTDVQRELSGLIAQILVKGKRRETAGAVLESLPDMVAGRVNTTVKAIESARNERTQRALVLELLDGVRGMTIQEAGKINNTEKKSTPRERKKGKGKWESMDAANEQPLDGIQAMFG